jgi:hypothetical protein
MDPNPGAEIPLYFENVSGNFVTNLFHFSEFLPGRLVSRVTQ